MRGSTSSGPSDLGRWIRWLVIAVVLTTYVLPGLFSSYRAWVQVRSLELKVPHKDIGAGDTVRVDAVSWGRTWVDVDVVLLQATRAETLAVHQIPKNHNASIDPRWRRDSIVVVLTREQLAAYEPGAATIRARAIGGPQWLRTPPPLVRESRVQLAPNAYVSAAGVPR
jgi:hypothetical protein